MRRLRHADASCELGPKGNQLEVQENIHQRASRSWGWSESVPWGLSFKGWVSRAKVLSTGKLTSQSELFIRHREEGEGGGWEHFEEEGHGTRITKDQGRECVFGPVGSQ